MYIMYESTRAFDVCHRTVCIRKGENYYKKEIDNLLTLHNQKFKTN